jgi:hypothetical protein
MRKFAVEEENDYEMPALQLQQAPQEVMNGTRRSVE